MPTYVFKNKTTGIEWEKEMKMSELDDYKKENDCSIVIQPQNKHVRVSKDLYSSSDGDFKDRMKNLKKAYPNATSPELKEW